MSDWNEDPPTIIEHTTVNPTVERNTVITRDSWYGEPWAIALIVGAIAVICLLAYWALYNPNSTTPAVVSHTTIEEPNQPQRAQIIQTPSPTPQVIVTPPASAPAPAPSQPAPSSPPVIINNTPSNSSGTGTPGNNPSGPDQNNPGNNPGNTTGDNSGNGQ